MPDTQPSNFERDPNAGAHLAGQFGGGAGNAETLIEANLMRFPEELIAANAIKRDRKAEEELDQGEVASIAGVDERSLLDIAVRGSYVTYVAVDAQGRTFKGVLTRDEDGDLQAVDDSADPRRALMAAHLEAAAQLQDAKAEAERIVLEAQAKAAGIVSDAVAEGQAKQEDAADDAAKAAAEAAEEGDGKPADQPADKPADKPSGSGSSRSSGRSRSRSNS